MSPPHPWLPGAGRHRIRGAQIFGGAGTVLSIPGSVVALQASRAAEERKLGYWSALELNPDVLMGRPFARPRWTTLRYAENVGTQFLSLRQNFLHHHSSPFEKPRHKADFIGLMALDTFATIRHNPDEDCGQLGYGIHDAHRKTDRRDVSPTV